MLLDDPIYGPRVFTLLSLLRESSDGLPVEDLPPSVLINPDSFEDLTVICLREGLITWSKQPGPNGLTWHFYITEKGLTEHAKQRLQREGDNPKAEGTKQKKKGRPQKYSAADDKAVYDAWKRNQETTKDQMVDFIKWPQMKQYKLTVGKLERLLDRQARKLKRAEKRYVD